MVNSCIKNNFGLSVKIVPKGSILARSRLNGLFSPIRETVNLFPDSGVRTFGISCEKTLESQDTNRIKTESTGWSSDKDKMTIFISRKDFPNIFIVLAGDILNLFDER